MKGKNILKVIFINLLLIIIFSFFNNVYCATYTDTSGNSVELTTPEFKHYVILERRGSYVLMALDSVYSNNLYVIRVPRDYSFIYSSNPNDTLKEESTSRVDFPYYSYSSSTNEWILSTNSSKWTGGQCNNIVYSTENIYCEGKIIYEGKSIDNYNFDISLSTTEETSNPIKAYSNYFKSEDALNYKCYVSEDGENFKSMNVETVTVGNISKVRYYYNILENGTYFFKFVNKETGAQKIITKTVTNIIFDNTSSVTAIPVPHITYTRENDNFVLKTQNFDKSGAQRYTGYYIKVTDIIDYSHIIWNSMDSKLSYNAALDQYEYYYSINVPVESENATYLFVFYDNVEEIYGNYNSFTTDIDYMIEYTDKTSGVTADGDLSSSDSRLTKLVNFFKQRFGFLTYPFEFISDFLNRILNINYSEPIIRIPELRDPFYNNKISDGIEFNFNSLLENSFYYYLHNIYLIAVDFILVFGLIKVSFSLLMEVLSNE